jgi:hypothetical protein
MVLVSCRRLAPLGLLTYDGRAVVSYPLLSMTAGLGHRTLSSVIYDGWAEPM